MKKNSNNRKKEVTGKISKLIYLLIATCYLLTVLACANPFFPEKKVRGGGSTDNYLVYNITMSDDTYGTATAVPETARQGKSVIINAIPSNGYSFSTWEVKSGGVSISDYVKDTATFTMPANDVEIMAWFEELPANTPNLVMSPVVFDDVTLGYEQPLAKNITIRNTGTGTAIVSGIQVNNDAFLLSAHDLITSIDANSTVSFFVQPKPDLTAGLYRTVITITYDDGKIAETIVSFEVKNTYTITMISGGNGTAMASITSAIEGTVITIDAIPNLGYVFSEWQVVSGRTSITNNKKSYTTFIMPDSNATIRAVFTLPASSINEGEGTGEELTQYNVTMQNDGNGTAAAAPNPSVRGKTIFVNATPKSGYTFDRWQVLEGGITLTDTNPASFTMPTWNVKINALFNELPEDTPNLVLTPAVFDDELFGYAQPSAKTITVRNTGTGTANITNIAIDSDAFTMSNISTTSINVNNTVTFTVQPKAGLTAGTYKATITASYDDDKTAETIAYIKVYYKVTLDDSAGNITTIFVDEEGYLIKEPAKPERVGPAGLYQGTLTKPSYIFDSWYYGEVKWDFNTVITENVTLKPIWIDPRIDVSGYTATTGTTIIDRTVAYVNANPNDYTLFIDGNISITGSTTRGLTITNAKLGIIGLDQERRISLSSQGRIITVGASGQTDIELIIGENVTFVGRNPNNQPVVLVQDAAFNMKGNSKITGNNRVYQFNARGSGVYVAGGIFTMQDNASISGNTFTDSGDWGGRLYGGGVYANGTFTMQDNASVSGNTITARNLCYGYGGGVYASGTFTMRDNASVSDNIITSISIGSYGDVGTGVSSYGGGVYVYGGTFTMKDSASISGNNITSSSYNNNNVPTAASYGESYGGGVYASGTFFTMQDNASISGNTATSANNNNNPANAFAGGISYGGGVYYERSGTFIMQDSASISGNTATATNNNRDGQSYGGGVCVYGGTFTMQNSASISGNITTTTNNTNKNESWGGGVHSRSTFRIADGTIYGNEATVDEALRNNASSGAALYRSNSTVTAQHGTFNASGEWESLGNLDTTNNTIRVVNGMLQ